MVVGKMLQRSSKKLFEDYLEGLFLSARLFFKGEYSRLFYKEW